MPGAPALVATANLTKRYGGERGIEDISLAIMPGETFGLLGPNGAGKTTLLRILLGLLHATSGTASIFGLDSRRDSLAIRSRIGNLPGDFAADPRRTGRAFLTHCAEIRSLPDLGSAPLLAERFRADLDRPLGELSRGNRQKIGLIQATFHEPELLILDEPTSGLDPFMQEEFLSLIGDIRARGGTILMSSHELDEVQRTCDRVAIVREGALAAVERVDDLRGRTLHHVRVAFAASADLARLEALPGVGDLTVDGLSVSFAVSGEIDAVVKELARHHIMDIELREPSLEEVFLTFYDGSGHP